MDDESKDVRTGVGYGLPPKATQFKKGQSGNPLGRPKKERGQQAIAARVLGEVQRISGAAQGARVQYTTLEAIVIALKQMAAAGHMKASTLFMRFTSRIGTQSKGARAAGYIVVPEEAHTIEEWEACYSPKDKPPDWDDACDEPSWDLSHDKAVEGVDVAKAKAPVASTAP